MSGGQSQEIDHPVWGKRQYDSVTATEIIQAKNSSSATNNPRNFLDQRTRNQIKATIAVAEQEKKRPVFWFKDEPHQHVREYIEKKGAEVRVGCRE